jgi:hypothetical protein
MTTLPKSPADFHDAGGFRFRLVESVPAIPAPKPGRNRRKHHWTDDEREIVRRDYQGTRESAQAIAARLGQGITWLAVRAQAGFLSVARRSDYRRRDWTAAEDDLLWELMPKERIAVIAQRLKRSIFSVTVRAKRLGISRRTREGWYTKREVCEIVGMDHRWVQRRIDAGALKARPYNPDQPPQKNGMAMWHIAEADLRAFLVAHADELNGRNVDLVQLVAILVPDDRELASLSRGTAHAKKLTLGV